MSMTMGPGKKPLVAQTHAGVSLGRGGFPSTRFHLNNLQVGGSHAPNFTLPVTDDLLLKCLVVNENRTLAHPLTTRSTPAATRGVAGEAASPEPTFPHAAWLHMCSDSGQDFPPTDGFPSGLSQSRCSPACWCRGPPGTPQGRPPVIR